MKYTDPKLRRALAAEYVLGTLVGRARRRFERLCEASDGAALADERRYWEQRLSSLDTGLKPLPPPETAWIGLERRIAADAEKVSPLRPAVASGESMLKTWALLAMAATVVLAVLLIGVYKGPAPAIQRQASGPAPYVAALNLPKAPMHFSLELSPERGLMKVSASGSYPDLGAHSLELWWISNKGPVALGVLPTQGQEQVRLPKGLPSYGKMTLAISLEPGGGSPTGQPTGPVLVSGTALRAL